MTVVDTSVWIANLRDQDILPVQTFRKLLAINPDTILIGDVVLLEVLQGARDEAHAAVLERGMSRFALAARLDPGLARQAAFNFRVLRQRGITMRKTMDLIVGTYCIERGHALLHNDRDFGPMATHLGLQLA